jgi:hypothetical protein
MFDGLIARPVCRKYLEPILDLLKLVLEVDDASLPVTSGNNTQTFDVKVGTNAFTVPMGLSKQSCFVSRNGAAVGGLGGDSL